MTNTKTTKAEKRRASKRAWYIANRDRTAVAGRENAKTWYYAHRDNEGRREKAKQKTKAWAEANPERKKVSDKAWREANIERKRAADRAYYLANIDKIKAKQKEYSFAHAEKARNRVREWQAVNPDKVAVHRRLMNAKRRDVVTSAGADMRIIQVFYEQAARLTRSLGIDFTVDHIIPVAYRGDHHHRNLQIMPFQINRKKGARLLDNPIWANPNFSL
jgi:hypothetical protein